MDNFSYNANFTTMTNKFMCTIEDGYIYQLDSTGKRVIGVISSEYDDLKNITDEYYQKLVELGAIIPQKTSEEILQETQVALAESQKALAESQATNKEILSILSEMKQQSAKVNKGGSSNAKSNSSSNVKSSDKNVPASGSGD